MFRRLVTVAVERIPTVASAFVAALDAATGDVIAQVEDHVLLEPGWAAAVLRAHERPSAAVAPRLANANPSTAISWANFLAAFSEAIVERPVGPVDCGPGHNTSYKAAVLRQYRDELVTLYQSERMFHYRLRQDGHVILHEPHARQAHLNISVFREAVSHAWLGGIMFGAYRGRDMGVVREGGADGAGASGAAAALVADVAPAVWHAASTCRPRRGCCSARSCVTHAAGEAVGYWDLVRDVESHYEHFELHRLECLRSDERPLMTGLRTA